MSISCPTVRIVLVWSALCVVFAVPVSGQAFFSNSEVAEAQQFQASHLALSPINAPTEVVVGEAGVATPFQVWVDTTSGAVEAKHDIVVQAVTGDAVLCDNLSLSAVATSQSVPDTPANAFATTPEPVASQWQFSVTQSNSNLLAPVSCQVEFKVEAWQEGLAKGGGFTDETIFTVNFTYTPIALTAVQTSELVADTFVTETPEAPVVPETEGVEESIDDEALVDVEEETVGEPNTPETEDENDANPPEVSSGNTESPEPNTNQEPNESQPDTTSSEDDTPPVTSSDESIDTEESIETTPDEDDTQSQTEQSSQPATNNDEQSSSEPEPEPVAKPEESEGEGEEPGSDA
jgi:hypothetical protein